jgi:hypothetical protein
MRQTHNPDQTKPSALAADTPSAPKATRALSTPATARQPVRQPARKPTSIQSALAAPTNPLMLQFVRDMAVAGLGLDTQETYLGAVQRFIQRTWTSPEQVSEAQLQSYLIALRERDVASGTFRVQRFALQFLFQNTLGRDWPLFKKN